MTSAWVFMKVTVIVLSIVAGLIFFYVTSPAGKALKKQQLEESISLIINFVLFIWAGKILLNLNIFITDPLAVLAYPSDSNAFYLALLLLLANLAWKVKKEKAKVETMLMSLMPVFLASAFTYEFLDIIVNDKLLSWGHLSLLFILLIVYLIWQERLAAEKLMAVVFALWSAGQLLIAIPLSFTVLYGYTMATWFLAIVFIISVITIINNKRKERRT
ncbi:hypothetical protein SAMN05216238_11222 [Lentibacillus persicus]|uniref:Uncharacterized protein n=1 Tax=Lentibacillus persicus TaxID=640948 RepID=A0A1I1ZAZ6_9BACI|nr:hypothetical protein [Lentibacillus persicus]SFE28742.1 hypothetical protein SAMN05216238_11222 [Lentibacillus persicus]